MLEFHDNASAVVGFETRSKLPCVLVQWDEEHNCEDCHVLLDVDKYGKENSTIHGWSVLGTGFVRHCDQLRKEAS